MRQAVERIGRLVRVLAIVLALDHERLRGAQPDVRNGVAAIVGGSVITFQEVELFAGQQLDVLRQTYGNRPEVYRQKRLELLQEALERLIERQLILDDFKTLGASFPETVIEDEINNRIRQRYENRVKLMQSLKAEGVSWETFRQRTREEFIIEVMRQRNLGASTLISPEKIETYYRTNRAEYQTGDEVKLRMLVLNRPRTAPVDEARRLAEEIRAKVADGASFAEMASIYSEGTQKREGGDWGWVARTRLNPGLGDVAFSLRAGTASGVIGLARDPVDGYWIHRYQPSGQLELSRKYTSRDVFVEEIKPGTGPARTLPEPQEFYLMFVEESRLAHVRPLEDVREQIEKELLFQERERMRKRWIDRLKGKSFVRYF